MDRRAFVKGCITAATAGAATASIASVAWPTTIVREPTGDPIEYFGLHKVAGPAPRGVPLIPLAVENGEVIGRPDLKGPDGNGILNWYRYCGHAGAPGLRGHFEDDTFVDGYDGDNVLRYFVAEDKLKLGVPIWYESNLGQPIKPQDFQPGQGAGFIWRSEGQTGANVVTGVIIRVPDVSMFTMEAPRYLPPASSLKEAEFERIQNEFVIIDGELGLVAASTYCTHFCCIPGWQEARELAATFEDPVNGGNAADRVFCTCHNSVYHPYQFVKYNFRPEVSSQKDEGGGGGF